jgi:CRP-like cAMP-binding protein
MILLEELRPSGFLQGMRPEYLRQVAGAAHLKESPAGGLLFCEGEASPFAYLILQGEVELSVQVPGRGVVPIQTAGPGDLLGWSPVLGLGPMTATARTRSRCRLAVLHVGRLLSLADADPRFGVEFLRRTGAVLAQRLGATLRRLAGDAGSSRPPHAKGRARTAAAPSRPTAHTEGTRE